MNPAETKGIDPAPDSQGESPPSERNRAASPGTAGEARERYLPIEKRSLIDLLLADFPPDTTARASHARVLRLLDCFCQVRYRCEFERIKENYSLFDPDADPPSRRPTVEQRQHALNTLIADFCRLLERGNYFRLDEEAIRNAIASASHWGLRLEVDFSIFERLEVFARGDRIEHRTLRRWRNLFRREFVPVPAYRRVAILFKLRDGSGLHSGGGVARSGTVFLKFFRDIPHADIEMMLPGSRVRMTLVDQGQILFPTITGATVAAYKLFKGALLLFFAGIWGMLAFLGIVGGAIGYGIRSILKYQRTKERYQLNLTTSLYYQNLDNNAGVLHRLLDDAEVQDFREAAVAWILLSRFKAGANLEELAAAANEWLAEDCRIEADFEVDDALEKLRRLDLISPAPGDRWQTISPELAAERIEAAIGQTITQAVAEPDHGC